MKKMWFQTNHRYLFACIEKFLKLMKITIFIITLATMQTFALDNYAQTKRMDVKIEQSNIVSALETIEAKSEFFFFYNNKVVRLDKKISVDLKEKTINEILDVLFKDTDIEYTINNRQIILSVKESGNPSDQQQKTVSGKVTDKQTGEPLIGVTVRLSGTTNGTVTDTDGSFRLKISSSDNKLVFSYIGYLNQEITIGKQSIINVLLVTESKTLDEVLVIGYGTAKKRDVVGAITKIKGGALEKTNTTSIAQGLQGLSAGLNVTNHGGGMLGSSGTSLQIRGISSISLSGSPLWVIDGVPLFTGSSAIQENGVVLADPLSMINPSDIESVEVLKDAAASAIYGNRASGGVILVTTKQSSKYKDITDITYDGGISVLPITQHYFLNNKEWLGIMDQANANLSLPAFDPSMVNGLFYTAPNISRAEAESRNTDYMSYLTRAAVYHQVSARTNKVLNSGSMMFSLSYRNEEGVLMNNDLQRLNARFNTNFKLSKALTIGSTFNAMYMKSNGVQDNGLTKSGGGWNKLFQAPPFFKIFDSTNPTGYWMPESGWNFAANHDPKLYQAFANEYRAINNIYAQLNLPIEGLYLRGEAGCDIDITNSQSWFSKALIGTYATAKVQSITRSAFTWNGTANYSKTFNEKSKISATIGGEATKTSGWYIYGAGSDMGTIYPDLINPNATNGITATGGLSNTTAMAGFFARANYSYASKYIISGSVRRDGHYALSAANRWADFAAGGLAWIVSDEKFMSSTRNWLSTLKLRTSYGSTGNTNMTASMLKFSYSPTTRYWYPGITGLNSGPSGPSDLKWEKSTTFDLGTDFGFLHDRINGSLSYYKKDVSNLIMSVAIPISGGLSNSSMYKNVGSIYSKGFEFNVSSTNVAAKSGFKWSTDATFTTNVNMVTSLNYTERNGVIDGNSIRKVGYALGTYYLAYYTGVDSQQGYYKIKERNETIAGYQTAAVAATAKELPMSTNNALNNRFIMKGMSADPKWYGSITNTFNYKGFDFNFMFTFAGGNWLYDELLLPNAGDTQAIRRDLLGNYWKKPGDKARYAKLYPSQYVPVADDGSPGSGRASGVSTTSFFLSRGDFLRLKNIQIGYSLPNHIVNKLGMRNMRFYVGASNQFLLTGFTGLDPESGNYIPTPKAVNFGVSVNF